MKRFTVFAALVAILLSLIVAPAFQVQAQSYDHTWSPGWGGPHNPGVSVTDDRSKGYWQYQYTWIQTGGTNGFIIVYYDLICVGKRCPSTSAATSCWITGYGTGPCAEGANASIPRNL